MMKTAAFFVIATLAMMGTERTAHAVPSPGTIDWSASPSTFVTSLYTSVLGRAPESPAVVAAWAANVTSTPGSRLKVFQGFIASPEYQGSVWARARREYFVFWKYDVPSNRLFWTVAKVSPSAEYIAHTAPLTWGVAMAMRGYFATFAPRR